MKLLVTKLKNNPSLRCKNIAVCLAKVKEGSTAFGSVSRLNVSYVKDSLFSFVLNSQNEITLNGVMHKEHKGNKKCSITMLKEKFWSASGSNFLHKHSSYTDQISKG